jgi:hypothetical protein
VSAAAAASSTQSGAASEVVDPFASRSAATIPTVFCASFDPWENASHADVTHCARRTGTPIA